MLAKRMSVWMLLCAAAAVVVGVGCQQKTEPVTEEKELAGCQVAILLTEGFQDQEALHPMDYLTERGATITVIGPAVETVKAYNSDVEITIEKTVAEVLVDDFDALVIPGGQSPARLREDETVVAFVREFVESGKPVAAICHGPQVLVAAGVMDGKRATCYAGIAQELIDAGVEYEDVELIRDGNIITSRLPQDLPVFSHAIAQALTEKAGGQ
jgi:protease I